MVRSEVKVIHIGDDRRELMAAVDQLKTSGRGWVNIEPVVRDQDRNEPPGIFSWFSARGPKVPMGTFVPGSATEKASVGLSHGVGRTALERLTEAGVVAPVGWIPRQDHPKRGLVWEIHGDRVVVDAVVGHLLEGTVALTEAPTLGGWVATFHSVR